MNAIPNETTVSGKSYLKNQLSKVSGSYPKDISRWRNIYYRKFTDLNKNCEDIQYWRHAPNPVQWDWGTILGGSHQEVEVTSPLISNRGQLFLPERDKTPGFSLPPAPSGRSSVPGRWGWELLSSTQTHSEGRSSTSGTTDWERWVLTMLPQPFWKTASEAT